MGSGRRRSCKLRGISCLLNNDIHYNQVGPKTFAKAIALHTLWRRQCPTGCRNAIFAITPTGQPSKRRNDERWGCRRCCRWNLATLGFSVFGQPRTLPSIANRMLAERPKMAGQCSGLEIVALGISSPAAHLSAASDWDSLLLSVIAPLAGIVGCSRARLSAFLRNCHD